MELTSLTIKPDQSWKPVGANNPLRAVVKLQSEKSTVECILPDDIAQKIIDLCATEIARGAQQQVNDFVSAVRAVEADAPAMIGEA